MAISFEGFPRILERSALKPGRWFVGADGMRPVLGLVTDVEHEDDVLVVTFSVPRVEAVEIISVPLAAVSGPFATVEDEVVFSAGLAEGRPQLVAPTRRAVRHGSLVRLRSGDLGLGFTTPGGRLVVTSLATGSKSEGFELVFERWALSLRRAGLETLIGYVKPSQRLESLTARP